jgi:hypothetical protein
MLAKALKRELEQSFKPTHHIPYKYPDGKELQL